MSMQWKEFCNRFFTQPFTDENSKRNITSSLRVILLVAVSLFPVYLALKLIESHRIYIADITIFGLELLFILLLFMLRKGFIRLVSILFLVSAWVALSVMAFYADGVKDIAVVGYIIIIFLATFFTGIRFAVVITGMSILSVWIMGYIHTKTGILPKGDSPFNYSRDYTVLFILVLTSIVLFARSYRYSFNRINKELQERIKAEEKLSKNEIVLKENNEELNRNNLRIQKMNEALLAAKDKAEESDRLKTAFLQNISHEIRTPMNGIVGFVNLLQQTDSDTDKQNEFISYIKSSSDQMITLINDIIDISKIESGTLEMFSEEFKVGELIHEIENDFSNLAKDKHIAFKVTDKTNNIIIRSDRNKIQQVLNNIINNALKFTSSGSVSVSLSTSGTNLVASVADTGIGIDDSVKAAIFNPFRQAEEGLTRSYGGSGLGLAISKGNIDFLGGKIWYNSESGKGSVFSFEVPVEFLSGSKHLTSEITDISLTRRLKILIAEDDEISAIYLQELISASDCDAVLARNGKEAVDMIRQDSKYDCILMDLKMSGINGYEATRIIKDLVPEMPVIAVTAFDFDREMQKTSGISFDGYIVKPILKTDLFRTITALVR
jgi:signal transduction histidine kinase